MQKIIITVDGRVCSGKSTFIDALQKELSQHYGYNIPHYSCGQYYRDVLKKSLPPEQIDDAMITYVHNLCHNNDVIIIDGRSVCFSIEQEIHNLKDKVLFSILCDVNKIEQIDRIKKRSNVQSLKDIACELERDKRDQSRCLNKFGKDIFDSKNYDLYLNTSNITLQHSISYVLDVLKKKRGSAEKRTALLFAEESETTLSNKMLERKDIIPIFLRFSKHLNFSETYLEKTKNQLTFILNMNESIANEALRFTKWIQKEGISLRYFCNDSEFLQEKAHTFARLLGLPSLSEDQVLWVRDKVKMKEKLKEIGLPVMNFTPINNQADILDFSEKFGFPMMFKPRKGFSSINTYKLSSIQDIHNLPIELKPDKFMVEAFNPHNEWAIDGLVQGGLVLDSYISHIPVSPLRAVVENKINAHITTPKKPKIFQFEARELLQKIVTGMNLKNGYIHMETFIDKQGEPTICEFGWRMAGCKIPENHSLAYGFDIYDVLLDIHIGKPVNIKYSGDKKCVGDLYLPNKSGIITKMTPLEELLKYEGVLMGSLFFAQGDTVAARRAGNDASGFITVEGKSFTVVKRRMHQILRHFQIKTEKER